MAVSCLHSQWAVQLHRTAFPSSKNRKTLVWSKSRNLKHGLLLPRAIANVLGADEPKGERERGRTRTCSPRSIYTATCSSYIRNLSDYLHEFAVIIYSSKSISSATRADNGGLSFSPNSPIGANICQILRPCRNSQRRPLDIAVFSPLIACVFPDNQEQALRVVTPRTRRHMWNKSTPPPKHRPRITGQKRTVFAPNVWHQARSGPPPRARPVAWSSRAMDTHAYRGRTDTQAAYNIPAEK